MTAEPTPQELVAEAGRLIYHLTETVTDYTLPNAQDDLHKCMQVMDGLCAALTAALDANREMHEALEEVVEKDGRLCVMRYLGEREGYTCLDQIAEAQIPESRFTDSFRAEVLSGSRRCLKCIAAAALAATPTGVSLRAELAETQAEVERLRRALESVGKRTGHAGDMDAPSILMPSKLLRCQWPPNDGVMPGDPKFDAILASIREHGILKPLVISLDWFVIDGNHRLAAARLLGLERVPVRIWTGSEFLPPALADAATPAEATTPEQACIHCGVPIAFDELLNCWMHDKASGDLMQYLGCGVTYSTRATPETEPTYVCTKCGWVGTEPKRIHGRPFCPSNCGYMVGPTSKRRAGTTPETEQAP